MYSDDAVRLGRLGGAATALTTPDPENAYVNLSWSPEGDRVAYVRTQSQTTRRYAVDVETGEVTRLPVPPAVGFKLSPDGSLAAFIRPATPGQGPWQLWVAKPDGSEERLLVDRDVASFAWSPDSRQVAYTVRDVGEVSVADVATGQSRQLASLAGYIPSPSWSPDGSLLALESGGDAYAGDLVVIEVATGRSNTVGQGLRRWPGLELAPQWSPDGRMLLYRVQDAAGITQVGVVDVGSGQARQLTSAATAIMDPRWSPDGKEIAFSRSLSSDPISPAAGLYVVAVESGQERELARFSITGGGPGNRPAWSPDGKRIAVYAQTQEDRGVYVVEADGSATTLVAPTGGFRGYSDLAWSDDGRDILLVSSYQGI